MYVTFNHYYHSELVALRELGRRFSERSPALAPFLAQSGQDPDVERLFEGFAFLTGRLRQKLDDELPELTHSLMHLLWPNYMRPMPSFSMLQFDPIQQAGPAWVVPRGTPVQSRPVDGVRCQFQTCFETGVLPLRLDGLQYSVTGSGAVLALQVGMTCEGVLAELDLFRLRLHLAGDLYVSRMLYLCLLRNLECIEVVPLDAQGKPCGLHVAMDPASIRPAGFAEEEALIPYPLNTFRGYRFLQEYFVFQDKFLFLDLTGLDALSGCAPTSWQQARGFELRFTIRKTGIERLNPSPHSVKLHCTPVVNLFSHDAQPIRLDGKQDEYLLLPAAQEQKHYEVFCIESVMGWLPGGKGYRSYVPFESFEHDADAGKPHYSVRQRPSLLHEGLDTYLGFGLCRGEHQESLSIELTCTNRCLPVGLAEGDICLPTEQTPELLRFRNITRPTASYAPPLGQDFLWKLISNMSLNYLSLSDAGALKVILETYDLPRYHDQQAEKISQCRLGGLKGVRHEHVDRLHKGRPVRGVRTELTLDPDHYAGEGDLFLFASVLDEFFALYASLNSFHELRVNSTQGEVYRWAARMGLQPLL